MWKEGEDGGVWCWWSCRWCEEEGGRGRGEVEEEETEEWMRTRTLELGDGAAEVVLDAGHACVSVVRCLCCVCAGVRRRNGLVKKKRR